MVGSAWEGRRYQYVYLASQQAMPASIVAMFRRAMSRAAVSSARSRGRGVAWSRSAMILEAATFQCPAGVGEPGESAQYLAVSSCSFVRVTEIFFTSSIALANSGESILGGAGGRNWSGELRSQGVTWCQRGRSGTVAG